MEKKRTTIVLFSGDYDKAMAAYIIANGAAAYDHEVTIFHTFWGINALRKQHHTPPRDSRHISELLSVARKSAN